MKKRTIFHAPVAAPATITAIALIAIGAAGLFARANAAAAPSDDFLRAATAKPDRCFTCHRGLGEAAGVKYATDVHYQKGVTCAGCHGGDPGAVEQEKAMDSAKGFVGVPKGDEISLRCRTCHSDAAAMRETFHSSIPVGQMEGLEASEHGKAVASGKGRMMQCTTCHSVHDIKAVADPRSGVHPANVNKTCGHCHSNAVFMRSYNPGLPIDQEEKYKTSVHGIRHAQGDLKTAVCSSCHGGHDILKAVDAKSSVNAANLPGTCGKCHANADYMKSYGIPTDQVTKFSTSVHGKALLEKHDLGAPSCNDCHGNHGAAPPEVESVSKVCGTCHAMNASLFAASPHKKAFDEMQLPECETCHGNHAIERATEALIGVADGAVCAQCHAEKEKGFVAAAAMRSMIDSLNSAELRADSLVSAAEQKGMEVGESRFKLRDVRQSILQSRTAVHSFDQAKFSMVVHEGMARAATVAAEGQASVDEFYFRRYGLGVATLIISVLAFALWAHIKGIEKEQAGKA